MTAEEVFKEALKELAAEGNEKAKFALNLAVRYTEDATEYRPQIAELLAKANGSLANAIRTNGEEWTKQTDTCIQNAMAVINQALIVLSRR